MGEGMTSWAIERPGRPVTMNAYRAMHYRVWGKHNALVRGEWKLLAKAAKVPPLDCISVHVHPLIKGGSVPDVGACAPDVKAAIDGIVDAGVIPDDTPEYVVSVTFHAPQKAGRDALVLVLCPKVRAAEVSA